MTKFGTKLPETGTHLQVICLHDDLLCMTGAMGYTVTPTKHSQDDQSGTKLTVESVATRQTPNSAPRPFDR